MIELSIVIPNLNERKTIGQCIQKAIECITKNNISAEIIVSDNGSIDGSDKLANDMGAKVIYCDKKGYGNALINGINTAEGKYILMGDADNTYNFLQINEFLEQAKKSDDISMVMGSRFKYKGLIEKGAMPFLHQYLGNPLLTHIVNMLFNCKLTDTQCGIRLFKKECFDKINFKSQGMEFATEIIIEFLMRGYKIVEIPTTLSKTVKGRKPHLNTFKDGFKILLFIVKRKFSR